ncbi:MAG: hypothetical protein ABJL99_04620 [Aliishimia sp.]
MGLSLYFLANMPAPRDYVWIEALSDQEYSLKTSAEVLNIGRMALGRQIGGLSPNHNWGGGEMYKTALILATCVHVGSVNAETRKVFLEAEDTSRIQIATIEIAADRRYSVSMNDTVFTDHFLSMRPFKCLEGAVKHWCHVPYPYDIKRDVSAELTDLEYDFLFIWKGATEYGINMWNGVYYRLEDQNGALNGTLYEIDMNRLASPPEVGNFRPVKDSDLHESDPESHWLPRLVIE